MTLSVATLTGTLHDTSGTPVPGLDVTFYRQPASIVGLPGGTVVKPIVHATTNELGELGVVDSNGVFVPGVKLTIGKYVMQPNLRENPGIFAEVIIDEAAIDVGTVVLEFVVGPAPAPEIISAAMTAATQATAAAAAAAQSAVDAAAAAAQGIADGDYGDIVVAAGNWTIDAGVVTLDKIAGSALSGGGSRLLTTDGGIPPGAILAAGSDGRAVEAILNLTADDLSDGSSRVMMTATERSKLAGVEAGATADQTGAEIVAAIDAELGGSAWQSSGVTDGDKGDITVLSDTWTINAGVVILDKIADSVLSGGGSRLLTTDGGFADGTLLAAGPDGRAVEASTATAATIGTKSAPVAGDKALGFDSEASNEVVQYSFTAIAGLMNNILSLPAARITSGTLANARISEGSVTQHAAAVATAANAVRSLVAGVPGSDAVANIVSLTQAEYDALGTTDPATLYVIVG